MPGQFFKSDRECAKEYATHPVTKEYIERLEKVAQEAYGLYADEVPLSRWRTLWDALHAINFLSDDDQGKDD